MKKDASNFMYLDPIVESYKKDSIGLRKTLITNLKNVPSTNVISIACFNLFFIK